MQILLNVTVNDKGNLEITASPEGIEYLQEQVEERIISDPETTRITWKQTHTAMWVDMLESYSCNGGYNLAPDNTFALTTSPIIADQPQDYDDMAENDPKVMYPDQTKFWYFPDYMVVSEFEKLLAGETVTFMAVPEEKEVHDITKESIIMLRKLWNSKNYSRYTHQQLQHEFYRRAEVREAEEAKKLKPSQKLQFILKNDPDNYRHNINEIYESSFCRALSKALPYTHFSNGKNYILRYPVNFEATIAEEKKRFEQYLKNELKVSIADFTLYYYHSSLLRSYWFRHKEGDQYNMNSDGYTDLAHLVMFLNDGIYQPNYSATNKFLDLHKIGYFSQAAYEYQVGDIKVKRYGNGRIDIKGLNDKQKAILSKLFALHEKLQNK